MTILHLIRLNGRRRVKSRNYWCVKGNSKPQIPIRPSLTVLWERLAVVGLLIDDDSDWQEEKGGDLLRKGGLMRTRRDEKEEKEMRLTCKRKGGEEDDGGCWQAGLPRLPRAAYKEWKGLSFGGKRKEWVPKISEDKQVPRVFGGAQKKGKGSDSEYFPFTIGLVGGWGKK